MNQGWTPLTLMAAAIMLGSLCAVIGFNAKREHHRIIAGTFWVLAAIAWLLCVIYGVAVYSPT